jgi:hypothetical protein
MQDSLKKLSEQPHTSIVEFVRGELRNKAVICGDVLEEARRLAQSGGHGTLLEQLAARARELYDDIAEMLVAVDPDGDRRESATAVSLRRQLEQLEAGITAQRQASASTPKSPRKR